MPLSYKKKVSIKHEPLEQQLNRVLVYKAPKFKSACLLWNIVINDMVLALFITAHLQMPHQKVGHSAEQLIQSTIKQYTSPIILHTTLQYHVLSLHCVGFGLYTLWQESWVHTYIPMQKAMSYSVRNSIVWFLTNLSTQIAAANYSFCPLYTIHKVLFPMRV